MKILFVITKGDNVGGAQMYVLHLAKAFLQDGFQVEVIVGTRGYLTDTLIEHGVKVHQLQALKVAIHPYYDMIALWKLYRLFKIIQPNIISLNSSKVGVVGRVAAFLSKKPAVFTVHGWSFGNVNPSSGKKFFKIIEQLLKPITTAWINVSQFDYELGIRYNTLKPNSAQVIYNGVAHQLTSQYSKTENTLCIVATARHDHQKDHSTLFKALQKLDHIKVYLLGDGPLINNNKKLAQVFQIADKVEFVGFTKEVAKYLSMADIFVLSTHWEGFPFSIIEAMQFKLPVVATDVCGIAEAVEHGKTGFLFQHQNVEELANYLHQLIQSAELRGQMGKAGFEKVQNQFNFEKMYTQTKSFLLQYAST